MDAKQPNPVAPASTGATVSLKIPNSTCGFDAEFITSTIFINLTTYHRLTSSKMVEVLTNKVPAPAVSKQAAIFSVSSGAMPR